MHIQVPDPNNTGEPKTKPTQHSVRELRALGLVPDIVSGERTYDKHLGLKPLRS